jgi:hypothetical protein
MPKLMYVSRSGAFPSGAFSDAAFYGRLLPEANVIKLFTTVNYDFS